MSKRKTLIELQSKPENKAVRQLIEKTKPVEYAPISLQPAETNRAALASETNINQSDSQIVTKSRAKTDVQKRTNDIAKMGESGEASNKLNDKSQDGKLSDNASARKSESGNAASTASSANKAASAQTERLRIFQTSTPVTRTITKFQKAAIVVRGENGKQLVELLWRDQMNEKTRDIWDYLVKKFVEAEDQNATEVSLRKRKILENSGVKSDRTFISAVYTLEDMGLIEVRRLSGNKEGNVYVLTEEGREEISSYRK